jgi:spore photoproduct lyase
MTETRFFDLSVKNLQANFSHIYLEKDAVGYELTDLLLDKYPNSKVIEIGHYKDIFNRKGQDFQSQKSSMNLILAKKKEPFLYPASDMVQEFKTPHTYYNTPILNCLYNCEYCFLQGMYPSGNIVIFVNENDLMNSIKIKLKKLNLSLGPMIVSISYNTDLMAMERIIPMASRWIEFCKEQDNLKIEIRTKSALFSSIKNIRSSKNVILSWTISPEIICNKYESTAPPLNSRVDSIKKAMDAGWPVRLCFDPVILVDDWYKIYTQFFEQIFEVLDHQKLHDITLGVFRMNKDYFNNVRKRETRSDLYYLDYVNEDSTITINKEKREKALACLKDEISKYIPKEKILVWI